MHILIKNNFSTTFVKAIFTKKEKQRKIHQKLIPVVEKRKNKVNTVKTLTSRNSRWIG